MNITKQERKILSKLGKKGGSTTVEKYGRLQMKEWGKLGGWPKGRKRKPEK